MDKRAAAKGVKKSAGYSRFLGYNYRENYFDRNKKFLEQVNLQNVDRDVYISSDYITNFEKRVAELFGHEVGAYFPTGAMAQSAATRVWSDREGSKKIAMHPTCQLYLYEEDAYKEVHRLEVELYGTKEIMPTAEDFANLSDDTAVVILELPMRHLGGQLIPLIELKEISQILKEKNVYAHLDGARVIDAATAYGISLNTLCSKFDSCYISLYKGMGLPAGAMLVGPEGFIEEANVWRKRLGGTLFEATPLLLGCDEHLDYYLKESAGWLAHAKEFAEVVNAQVGLNTDPNPIETNIVHVVFDAPADVLEKERDAIARELDIWTFSVFTEIEGGTKCYGEAEVRDPIKEVSNEELQIIFNRYSECIQEFKG